MRSRNILPLKKAFGSCRTVVTSVANQSGGHVHLGLTGPAVLWFSVVRTEETAETYAALVAVRMGAAPTNMLFDGIVAVSLRAGYPDMSGPFSTRLSVNGKGPDLYWAAWDRIGAPAYFPNELNKLVVYVEDL